MTYDQLAAFVRVGSLGSFTAASASLHKSQPAVSKLVRNLEEELDLELFDRSAYRASLTDAGRLFFERAAALMESTEALRSFAAELAGAVEPVVRLAVEAVTPPGALAPLLRAALARFPTVRIELRTERLAGAVQAVNAGEADLAVATLFGVDTRALETRRVAAVRVVPVARADHPLARAGAPTPEPLLREHAQIVLRDSAQGETDASLNVLPGGLRWTVTDVAAKRELIGAGLGWGGLPEHVVAEDVARGELAILEVPDFESTMELFAVRRRDRPRGPVMQALWDGLVDRGVAAEPAR